MKCKVCGAESGKYPLCRMCNSKKEKGEIIKCAQCNNWHYTNAPCHIAVPNDANTPYLYEVRKSLISKSEQAFYSAIQTAVPQGYCVFPQINLAAFIDRTDNARYHNELFRNVDFLVTDAEYCPKLIIEINDQTHLMNERKERDEKVRKICEEAGIPILKLWTSYGVDLAYIQKRIDETLQSLPIARIHHAQKPTPQPQHTQTATSYPYPKKKQGCYIATCVYGSYDCPAVWTLRRYRDEMLSATWYGRTFIRMYYAVSPALVHWFGESGWFRTFLGKILDKKVQRLQEKGVQDTPYDDK